MGWLFIATKSHLQPDKFWGLCRGSLKPRLEVDSEDGKFTLVMWGMIQTSKQLLKNVTLVFYFDVSSLVIAFASFQIMMFIQKLFQVFQLI